MVGEFAVLLRIEHFKQRGRRVAVVIAAELVDLIQHEDRVDGARLLHGLKDAAGQGADVGAPMTADLRFIRNAAKGNAHKVLIQRFGNRTADGSLAGSRRADEAEDRLAFLLRFEGLNRDVFDNAVLRLLQAVVVAFQNFLGVLDVEVVFGFRVRPRKVEQPINVSPRDADFRRHRGHLRKAFEFLQRDRADVIIEAGFQDLFLQLREFTAEDVAFAEFVLNGFLLFAQVILALGAVYFVLNFLADLILKLEDFDFLRQVFVQKVQPLQGIQRQQDVAALFGGEVDGRRDHVRNPGGIVDRGHEGISLLRQLLVKGGAAFEQIAGRAKGGGEPLGLINFLVVDDELTEENGLVADDLLQNDAAPSLNEG